MIVIICAKYEKNPSKTVDATERTRFSKSRPNDLEDIGQGQRSSHATHPVMLLIICAKYGKNPSWTVDATERTRDAGRTDGRTEWNQYTPQQLRCVGGIMTLKYGHNVHVWSLLELNQEHFRTIWSILWPLMPWLLASPGHQNHGIEYTG